MKITVARKVGESLCFDAKSGEKVLHAALRSRLTVPYECATGTCGSCRAKLVSGELDQCWSNAPGRKALKVNRGEFLMCQCVAQSDCEIRIPAVVEVKELEVPVPAHIAGSISGFKNLTGDVMSFSVSLQQEMSFQAGQFILLQLPGVEGARAYSMVNYATRTRQLEFVIKRFKGGKCSEWFFDKTNQNSDVTLFGPLGHAVFEPQLEHDLLLLAGGSGIAGMMAILEQADQIGYLRTYNIDLIFGVKSAQDTFYLPILRKHAAKYPDTLQISIALSEAQNADDNHGMTGDLADLPANLKIAQGFVHELVSETRANTNTMGFIAGPPPMVDASIRELIVGKEFDVDRIRYDKFA